MFINQILTKLKSLVYSKSEADSLLNGKASSSHTHTKSQITDFPTIPSKVSQLTNDSGFITSGLPIGSYIQFAGSQAPDGFLVCNGGEISRTTYSQLFAVIGTTYGSGDGSTTFNLPNLTDRFLQGSSTSGTVKNAGLPNITGVADGSLDTWVGKSIKTGVFSGSVYRQQITAENDITTGSDWEYILDFDASRSNSIYGSSSTVQPPALTCLICIKY